MPILTTYRVTLSGGIPLVLNVDESDVTWTVPQIVEVAKADGSLACLSEGCYLCATDIVSVEIEAPSYPLPLTQDGPGGFVGALCIRAGQPWGDSDDEAQ